jgi:hypothetical protein
MASRKRYIVVTIATASYRNSKKFLVEERSLREGEERCNRYGYTFTPRGGSIVILLLFCKMLTGKSGEGADVSHNRNA